MLRVLFSRLGKPHIGSPNAFSFNVPSVRGAGAITIEKGARTRPEKRTFTRHRRHVPALRGHGVGDRHRPVAAVRRQPSRSTRARSPSPATAWTAGTAASSRLRLLRPGQADPRVHQEGAPRPALQGADQDQGRRHQPDVRGADPADPEVVPVQGHRRDAAAHPRVRGAGGHVHHLSRVRRHPAQRGRPVVEDRGRSTSPTPAPCRSATWPSGCAAWTSRPSRRCWRRCGTPSTRSWRSGWATSASTGRPARCRAARRSAPR